MQSGAQRLVVITGGAEGIGWATAQLFADKGYHVAIIDIDAEKVIQRATSLGPAHSGHVCDIAVEAEAKNTIIDIVDQHGGVDVLVNNAGIGDTSLPTLEQNATHFQRVIDVHLTGTFTLSRLCADYMVAKSKGGAIVNFSSIAGLTGLPGRNAYGAAKAGIIAMTKSMASEWGSLGIRVNAVAPGYVKTALVAKLVAEGLLDEDSIVRRTPLGRFINPAEIAEAVYFLASPVASAVTGAVLSVDAGWMAYGAAGQVIDPDQTQRHASKLASADRGTA
ncbi:SDR family NAD(P)-dependent oxidoreductase [Mariluticola halotolerans]|uniref:SDR family NAD(P)-dependent oxidoreductase n=1 Tax=Mariluticola halotolerans TaxID=2909283 RepID=UPI0026E1B827|nr:SDR family oxidoreductase [Mariluticola halotolerans]UJQ94121.1 SDR family oxidoreductase [Mariluticola halotolerans]